MMDAKSLKDKISAALERLREAPSIHGGNVERTTMFLENVMSELESGVVLTRKQVNGVSISCDWVAKLEDQELKSPEKQLLTQDQFAGIKVMIEQKMTYSAIANKLNGFGYVSDTGLPLSASSISRFMCTNGYQMRHRKGSSVKGLSTAADSPNIRAVIEVLDTDLPSSLKESMIETIFRKRSD